MLSLSLRTKSLSARFRAPSSRCTDSTWATLAEARERTWPDAADPETPASLAAWRRS